MEEASQGSKTPGFLHLICIQEKLETPFSFPNFKNTY
jgi:hypothetical protein